MTATQQRALAALLTAPNKAAAAQAAGISPRTLRAYLADPSFRQEYQRAFAELLEDATRQAQQALAPALHTLKEIAEDAEAPPAARISAARATLEYGLRLTEATDVLQRLDELEERIGGKRDERTV